MNDGTTYLVITERVTCPTGVLYEGVSFPDWTYMGGGLYIVAYEGLEYIAPIANIIFTKHVTRTENIAPDEYTYKQRADDTTDYVKALAEYGIDIKKNYSPQFRDGKNPYKDNNQGYERKTVSESDNT